MEATPPISFKDLGMNMAKKGRNLGGSVCPDQNPFLIYACTTPSNSLYILRNGFLIAKTRKETENEQKKE
jgi:hypothetical protein